ncbi:hypothetical protein CHS0354_040871 [Potamilus streckersoni]|uniref:Uncharacterized protein n=1 Tax=Potamilus streckersoni TaxID=2493646 RepID=A0AAE0VXY3_9BIVA|nr:hypothetical protein CHS0354_040871 [Potamilus streckersoni]
MLYVICNAICSRILTLLQEQGAQTIVQILTPLHALYYTRSNPTYVRTLRFLMFVNAIVCNSCPQLVQNASECDGRVICGLGEVCYMMEVTDFDHIHGFRGGCVSKDVSSLT